MAVVVLPGRYNSSDMWAKQQYLAISESVRLNTEILAAHAEQARRHLELSRKQLRSSYIAYSEGLKHLEESSVLLHKFDM
jgi:hypothetical protein